MRVTGDVSLDVAEPRGDTKWLGSWSRCSTEGGESSDQQGTTNDHVGSF